jgi:uncharacterized protein (DUF1499 family)
MPRIVQAAAGLTLLSALLLLAAPAGYAAGILDLRAALLRVFIVGFIVAALAALAGLAAVIIILRQPAEARAGLWLAAGSLVAALVLLAMPARYLLGFPPPIHDITTDTENPPEYVAVLPLRQEAPNPAAYGGEQIAAQQRAAYPDIQPLELPVPPDAAFDRALAAVDEMEWEVVDANRQQGRIEATDTTFWFRFKDDIVIRITPSGAGSRIDVRSLSRVGQGDAGTNAARIRDYLDALRAG